LRSVIAAMVANLAIAIATFTAASSPLKIAGGPLRHGFETALRASSGRTGRLGIRLC
jgi:hypothetical protein